ncbi:MAG: hypothetical protein J7605_02625 [Variovorax sp.]|nr:hypothetical protein [Variovorax sp.]
MTETTTFPEVAAPQWDNVPASLATRQQWLLWKFEAKAGQVKPAKIPYYVAGGRRTGSQGDDRDLHRLATLSVVRRAYERGGWHGVGFAFLPGDGLIGIDLDGQLEGSKWSDRCKNIVAACDSFTEISPSGKGVHIIVQGETATNKSNDIGVEVFTGRQFFTVTANRFPNTPAEVRPIDESALRRLHKTIDDAKAARAAAARPASKPRAAPPPHANQSGDDFQRVKDAAMQALHAWVPALFGGREARRGEGYRVTSKALNRPLQEDLSITPEGIVDWGVADMGDPKQGARTPIDLVMEWLPADSPSKALHWLAGLLGIDITPPKSSRKKNRDENAPAGGGSGGAGGPPPGNEPPHDDHADDGRGKVEEMLVRTRGKPMDCRENVLYCMTHDPDLQRLISKNEFTLLLERNAGAPWGRPAGEWDEEDDLMLGEFLLRTYGLSIKSKGTLRDGVMMAARLNKYNPIVDLIRSEVWDQVPRIEQWLVDVFGVDDRPYTRLIGKFFMMGLVRRALQPGCKFDYMLILKGEQGLKKSGVFRELAFPWFTDNAIRVGDKDSMMAQQLAWIVESAELESLNKSESTAIKQHLSAQEDWYRPPYGSQLIRAPRHSVHVGTTNADTFLKDATGDRRFWPLEVKTVEIEVIRAARAQLLAEALHYLDEGERYWPTKEEERELIFPEQEPFKRSDTWEDMLSEYVNAQHGEKLGDVARWRVDFFPTVELYAKALNIKADRIDGNGQMDARIGNAMRALGFEKHRETTGSRLRGWRRNKTNAPAQPAASPAADAPEDDREDLDVPF